MINLKKKKSNILSYPPSPSPLLPLSPLFSPFFFPFFGETIEKTREKRGMREHNFHLWEGEKGQRLVVKKIGKEEKQTEAGKRHKRRKILEIISI